MAKKQIDITDLVPDKINANRGTDKGRKLVRKSFDELGAGRSVLVDKDNNIIAGNKSTEAAKEKGLKIRVVETDGTELVVVKRTDVELDSEKGRKLAIADNATAQAGLEWDEEVLQQFKDEWDIDAEDWGVELPDMQEDEETHLEAKEDDYQIPDNIITDIVTGDLFEFKKEGLCHRLFCGDSTNVDDVEKLMNGEKADMVFTDPPHEVEQDSFISFLDIYCSKVKFIMHNDKYLSKLASQYIERFERYFVHDFIFHIGGGNRFFSQNDLIACFDYSSEFYQNLHDGYSTVIRKMTERQKGTKNLVHPHSKPVYLVEGFISHFCKKMDCCLDLYLGSGTTMVAAHQLKRNCYGMELSEDYCQVIVDRMLKLDEEIKLYRNGNEVTEKYRAKLNGSVND